jgi:hypothetical protein
MDHASWKERRMDRTLTLNAETTPMVYLADISWAQIILIELGALFQFIALCAFVRETSSYRHRKRAKEVEADPHAQESQLAEQAAMLRAIRAVPVTHETHHEPSHSDLRAADLMKTAKVKFKQSFKFRPHDS